MLVQDRSGTAGGTAQATQTANTNRGAGIVPFRRATREHSELVNDQTYTMTVNPQNPAQGAISVPAYGYLRGLLITVVVTGGVAGTAFQEDGPWSVLQNIILSEPNGAAISQFNSGYELYLAAKWGGYFGIGDDPRQGIFTSAMPNFQFQVYIPLELNQRDGLGSLPNQNAAAMFQLRYQVAGSGSVYTTTPTTQPTVQVTVEAMEYDQPQASSDGMPNQTTPPAMNTTQFWSVQPYPVVAGANRIRLTRVGNYIRHWGFIFRAATRALGDTNWPVTTEIDIDARPLTFLRKLTWRQQMYQRYGYDALTLDAVNKQDSGVFWFDFCHEFDGTVGFENRDGWLKTYGSTRAEVVITAGVAGTLTVLTNDVAIASNVFMGA